MNRAKILASGIGILAVLGVAYYLLSASPNFSLTPNPEERNEGVSPVQSLIPEGLQDRLFVATFGENEREIQILLFDPKNKEVLLSKTITAREQISGHNRYNQSGANDAVQFNPQTNEIFYLTQGYAAYDGRCANSDGTCADRIYKANLQTGEQSMVFEFNFEEDWMENWIFLPKENALLLSLYSSSSGAQRFVKVSLTDGKIIWNSCCEHFGEVSIHRDELILSGNAQEAYQIRYTHVKPRTIALETIDTETGSTSVHHLYSGQLIDAQTRGISPDGKFLAFYEDDVVKLYDFSSHSVKGVSAGVVGNYNLHWSGNTRLIIEPAAGWIVYDVEKGTTGPMPDRGSDNLVADLAAPSDRYVIFSNLFAGIFPRMLDVQTNEIIDLPIKGAELVGASWY